jgi:hypothetical protein
MRHTYLLVAMVIVLALIASTPLLAQAPSTPSARDGPFAMMVAELAKSFGMLAYMLVAYSGAWLLAKVTGATGWIDADRRSKLEGLLGGLAGRAAAWAEEKAAQRLAETGVASRAEKKLAAAREYLQRKARAVGTPLSDQAADEILEGVLPFVGLGASAKTASPPSQDLEG